MPISLVSLQPATKILGYAEVQLKFITLLITACLVSGCMSIYTLTPEFEKELLKPDPCPQGCRINRVYSGSKLGICALSSGGGGQGAGIMFWDLPFSMVLDTVVLPYTIYKQATVGGGITLQGLEGECEKAED